MTTQKPNSDMNLAIPIPSDCGLPISRTHAQVKRIPRESSLTLI